MRKWQSLRSRIRDQKTAEVGLFMRKKAFTLFTQISFILISAAVVFAQGPSYSDRNAGITRQRTTESATTFKKTLSVYELEKIVFDLVNERRRENGLSALKWSEDVAKVARLHSQNMASSKVFGHRGLDGLRVDDRAASLGVKNWQAIGENIAANRGFANPTASAVQQWMNSSGHRASILNNGWTETGIGIACDNDGKYYFTQVFLLRR